jgi:hypothetical protein
LEPGLIRLSRALTASMGHRAPGGPLAHSRRSARRPEYVSEFISWARGWLCLLRQAPQGRQTAPPQARPGSHSPTIPSTAKTPSPIIFELFWHSASPSECERREAGSASLRAVTGTRWIDLHFSETARWYRCSNVGSSIEPW